MVEGVGADCAFCPEDRPSRTRRSWRHTRDRDDQRTERVRRIGPPEVLARTAMTRLAMATLGQRWRRLGRRCRRQVVRRHPQQRPVDRRGRTAPRRSPPRDQSIKPSLPSSSSTARCRRRHRPASVQTVNRRCAVGTVTPNDGGTIRHAHPLASTNTTAVNTARWSTGAVPPPCVRGTNSAATAPPAPTTRRPPTASTTRLPRPKRLRHNRFRHRKRITST